ncbi:hypothetical protein MNKW57_11910 [Biformimicrobium ophioploci]|uniref:Uncharacterized protein n=1 Tax=Biformimicrobium ophioploci TaxID=3036711 RepID=A0ABQ6LXU4_9GAMM|nr:hypothetical protein MNKW57_11910 [Microbulbifer sp. NKW57]
MRMPVDQSWHQDASFSGNHPRGGIFPVYLCPGPNRDDIVAHHGNGALLDDAAGLTITLTHSDEVIAINDKVCTTRPVCSRHKQAAKKDPEKDAHGVPHSREILTIYRIFIQKKRARGPFFQPP